MILSAKLSVGCTIGRYSLEKNADFFKKSVFFMFFVKNRAQTLPYFPYFNL